MTLFLKTKHWIAASFAFVYATVAAPNNCAPTKKSFDQGRELSQMQLMPAYNAPSRIDVRGSWDVYATGSFTYWQPIQENMELGAVENTSVATDVQDRVINANFDYAPGFQFGLGLNLDQDNWDTYVEYTWFRDTQSNATHLDPANASVNILPAWIYPPHGSFTALDAEQKWKIHMDLLDWELARSYYVGTKLSFRPFFAARAAWIRQNVRVFYQNGTLTTLASGLSHSWGVGPRAGLYSSWLLGEGIRVFGNAMGDLLFTQYSHLRSTFNRATSGIATQQHTYHQSDLNTLRTHLELEMGFGWGCYFDNNNWHVDLAAGYGFQVFFDQNMFRKFFDDVVAFTSISPNGNLYVHGLTITGRFDF